MDSVGIGTVKLACACTNSQEAYLFCTAVSSSSDDVDQDVRRKCRSSGLDKCAPSSADTRGGLRWIRTVIEALDSELIDPVVLFLRREEWYWRDLQD